MSSWFRKSMAAAVAACLLGAAVTPAQASSLAAQSVANLAPALEDVPSSNPAPLAELADVKRVDLATHQDGKYRQYRIPAMIVTNDGTIVTAYDGRHTVADLPSFIDTVVRISKDGGTTWTEQKIAHGGNYPEGYGDPSLGYNPETNRVFLFYTGSKKTGFLAGTTGIEDTPTIVQHWVSYSDDNGASWEHHNITPQVKDPAWAGGFAASGMATYIATGPFKGRLVQQYLMRTPGSSAVSAWTDDNGATWQHGAPLAGADENKTAAMSNGNLIWNNRAGDNRQRAYSTDGGATWGPKTDDPALIDATSNGSITRVFPTLPASDPKSKWMLSTNNFDKDIRMNTTIRLSCDDGTTWPVGKVLEVGSSGYSTAAMIGDKTVGVLYERNGYADITFASFPLAELEGTCAPLSIPGSTQLAIGGTTTVPVTVTNQNAAALPAGTVTIDGGTYVAGSAAAPAIAAGAQAVVNVPVATSKNSAVQAQDVQATYTAAGKSSQVLVRLATVAGTGAAAEIVVFEDNTPKTYDGTSLSNVTTGNLDKLKNLDNGSISVTFNSTNSVSSLPQTLFGASQKSVDDHELLLTVNSGKNPYYEIRAARPNFLATASVTANIMDGADHTVTLTAANGTTKFFVDGAEKASKAGQFFFKSLPNLDTVTIGGVHFKTSANTAGPTDQWFFKGTIKKVKVTTSAPAEHGELVPAPSVKIETILDVFNYASPPGLGIKDKGSYMVRITNDGNVPLSNIAATSSIDIAGCFSGTLAPGAQQFCRAKKHTFDAADVAAGSYTPQMTLTATAAGAPFTSSATGATIALQAPFELPAAPAALTAVPAGCAPTAIKPVSAKASSEESLVTYGSEDTPASNAIDGNNATFFSTGWSKGTMEFPNSLSVDLGENLTLCGVNYTARQNNTNGAIGDYRVYVSDDGVNWGSPVAGGKFVTGNNKQSAYFAAAATGRYVKLVSYNDIGAAGTETTTVAEFSVSAMNPGYVPPTGLPALIPEPNSVVAGTGPRFGLTKNTPIVTDAATATLGSYLADLLKPAAGFTLKMGQTPSSLYPAITLASNGPASLGEQGYTLSVKGTGVLVTGNTAEGVFNGIQTLRQLLPVQISAETVQLGAWTVEPVEIADKPRWDYRGAMLDAARRYYPVADVKKYLDYMAEYKLNAFHFHLTEDQGWRIAIDAYPALTGIGASVQSGMPVGTVDNGVAGPWFYSKAEYKEIVDYATARFIEVIPEIDGPGHAGAAMAAVPNLNCNNVAIPPWTNYGRGPNFCLKDAEHLDNVKTFLTAVMADVAAQNNTTDYIHVGGDESAGLTHQQFTEYTKIVNKIVTDNGKKVIAWNSWADGEGLPAGGVLQNYAQESGDAADLVANVAHAVEAGNKLIMSPADRTYVDMKYDATTKYGLRWVNGGFVSLARSYQWEPTTAVPKAGGGKLELTDSQILGVEVALWSDATNQNGDILWTPEKPFDSVRAYMNHMMFPRFPAVAELAWSAKADRQNDPAQFEDFTARLINRAQGWDEAKIGYYRAPDVAWKSVGAPALPASAALTLTDFSGKVSFDAAGKPVFTATGTLSGVTGTVTATVNGTAHAITANGAFNFSVPAVSGANTVAFSALDANGALAVLPQSAVARVGALSAVATAKGWTLAGSGFTPGQQVALSLHSDPLPLGNATADGVGAFTLDVATPAGATAGSHQIRAVGASSIGSVAVTVAEVVVPTPSPSASPSATPSATASATATPTGAATPSATPSKTSTPFSTAVATTAPATVDDLAKTGANVSLLSGLALASLLIGVGIAVSRKRRSRHA
ncbi:family 20 glycosylhydrolase [Arthrobacter glacialis]|nr:family 20 glycosylhydrolase [Arthrobacter glacialis]